jgi:hypothetical protein
VLLNTLQSQKSPGLWECHGWGPCFPHLLDHMLPHGSNHHLWVDTSISTCTSHYRFFPELQTSSLTPSALCPTQKVKSTLSPLCVFFTTVHYLPYFIHSITPHLWNKDTLCNQCKDLLAALFICFLLVCDS